MERGMQRCKASIEDLQLAFLCGLHDRLGSVSPVKRLHVDMCKYIAQEAKYFHVSHVKREQDFATISSAIKEVPEGRCGVILVHEGEYTESQGLKICKRLTLQASNYERGNSFLKCSLGGLADKDDMSNKLKEVSSSSSSPSSPSSPSDLEWPEELLMAIPPTLGGGILAGPMDEQEDGGNREEEERAEERLRIRSRLQEEKEGRGLGGSRVVMRMWSGDSKVPPRYLVCVVGSQTHVEINGLTIMLLGGRRPEEAEGANAGDRCESREEGGRGERGEGGEGGDGRDGGAPDGGEKSCTCEEEVRWR
ncbi:hypothetical protein GUITHDRAFT_111811 [Guillardia theta CCMP2712]|uniref:Uncharacterized protein n=2 Tax=Guillardia theta TaxID=55529 RepID=L1J294_GUITC|nr:hypothetical protein GUITHDRAFT_111811 [Guillardia theta CCMP2712]EKX42249.1 hypothetical protein GUITHDRAFT_111811 [Guillardia theta CCMP2712]|eukprot:XP_005829229.1 hypothetical protein GUITHDRAFT_111811 [Guillardia theta CCMP2712]